jgi:acyl carrier protein
MICTDITADATAKEDFQTALRGWLVTNIAEVLEIEPASIDVTRNLDELGLDSLQSVCLAGDLEAWLGLEIPATAIWDYPTIESLCEYLTRVRSVDRDVPDLTFERVRSC